MVTEINGEMNLKFCPQCKEDKLKTFFRETRRYFMHTGVHKTYLRIKGAYTKRGQANLAREGGWQ